MTMTTTITTDEILDKTERYLSKSIYSWRNSYSPEVLEDALQEGMIQAWRDVEDGYTEELHILRRAKMKSDKFIKERGEYFFGKAPKSRDGIRANDTAINKVQVFLQEYLPVHGNVMPSAAEVSRSLGITPNSAGRALKAIREGRVDHMKYYEGNGRMDWDYYSNISLEVLQSESQDSGESRSWDSNAKLAKFQTSFETDAVSNLDVVAVLEQLTPRNKEVLYLVLFEGYSPADIGRHFKVNGNLGSKGGRLITTAFNQASIVVNPYSGECAAGHPRNPVNTMIVRRPDQSHFRACLPCQRANSKKGKRASAP